MHIEMILMRCLEFGWIVNSRQPELKTGPVVVK